MLPWAVQSHSGNFLCRLTKKNLDSELAHTEKVELSEVISYSIEERI